MIYVYAVIDRSALPLPEIVGLQRRPLNVVESAGTVAAYTGHADSHLPANAENIWQHEAVVEALMSRGALLPVRFGTTFSSLNDLENSLTQHAAPLAAGLERVKGCVELGLRVFSRDPLPWTSPVSPAGASAAPSASAGPIETSGRAYMTSRLAEQRRRSQQEHEAGRLCDAIHARLVSEFREGVRRLLPTLDVLMSGAYLVPVEQTARFRSRIGELSEANPNLRLLFTGPWPPYHFSLGLTRASGLDLSSASTSLFSGMGAQNV